MKEIVDARAWTSEAHHGPRSWLSILELSGKSRLAMLRIRGWDRGGEEETVSKAIEHAPKAPWKPS